MSKLFKSILPLLIAVAAFVAIQNWWRMDLILRPIEISEPIAAKDVSLYSTRWCSYCDKARSLLQQANIPFQEYDIEQSARAYQNYQQIGGRGVPVIKIGSEVVYGFKPGAIRRALAEVSND